MGKRHLNHRPKRGNYVKPSVVLVAPTMVRLLLGMVPGQATFPQLADAHREERGCCPICAIALG